MESLTEFPLRQCLKILEAVFGVHRYWKRMLLLLVQLRPSMRFLDLVGGIADIVRLAWPWATVRATAT